jgi:hypothetical protein
MPGTLEGLIILLVFIVPGFITVRTREVSSIDIHA